MPSPILLDIGLCFIFLFSQHVINFFFNRRRTGTITAIIKDSDHPIQLSSGESFLIGSMTKVKRTHRFFDSLDSDGGLKDFASVFRTVSSFDLIYGSKEIRDEVS